MKDRTRYLFDGAEYGKGKLVLAIAKALAMLYPDATLRDLQILLPDALIQGSMKTVDLYSSIKKAGLESRYFTAPNELITLKTGHQVCVTTQMRADELPRFLEVVNRVGFDVTTLQ